MGINHNLKNRIKPKLLREQKTEALLVFIRTTLEQSFEQIDTQGYQVQIGSDEDTQYIYDVLRELKDSLKECVVNSSYLRSLVSTSHKNQVLKMLAKKEEPLMVYYDAIVKGIEINLVNGTKWIPELMVISLLSEWVIEEEKSIHLYPFLGKIDYIDLIDKFDNTKFTIDKNKKDVIMNMYRISADLIKRLKNTTYKININRKSKSRKK